MEKQLIAQSGHECNGAIIGMLLGDSHLRRSSPTANTYMCTKHEIACRDYLEWKKVFLSSYFDGEIKEEFQKGDGNKWRDRWAVKWDTHVAKRLNYHYQDFYPYGKKIVKRSVLNRLTPLGLAIWYADDGSFHINKTLRGIDLYTDGFDEESIQTIIKWFKDTLGFHFNKTKRGYIYTDVATAWRFLAIVKPYLSQIPSMYHKINIDRVDYQSSIALKTLPPQLIARLLGEDNSTPTRGYVWQLFPYKALWPERMCIVCGKINSRKLSQYCSQTCYSSYWYQNRSMR